MREAACSRTTVATTASRSWARYSGLLGDLGLVHEGFMDVLVRALLLLASPPLGGGGYVVSWLSGARCPLG